VHEIGTNDLDLTKQLKAIYHETAREVGYEPGPEHFGYLMRCLVADTDEKAQEVDRARLKNCRRPITSSWAVRRQLSTSCAM
jgi:hypothetical protein